MSRFHKLFSQDLISKNTLYSTIANLSIGNLPHDRVNSYLVRRRLFSADLTSNITDHNVRIMTYLSLDPEKFSEEISNQDFLILVNSLFFSLILSTDQLKTYIQSDMSGESEQIIRNFVYSVTNSLQTQTIKTPYDYSVMLGVRKIARMVY